MTTFNILSISALQSLAAASAGDTAIVAGYTTVADGGGGIFTFETAIPASTIVADAKVSGTTVTATTGAPHNLIAGQQVMVGGIVGFTGPINGTFTVTSVAGETFTYTSSGISGTYTSGGIIGDGGTTVVSTATAGDDPAPTRSPRPRTGLWRRLYAGALDVRWFGAVGDGSTNNDPTFAAAFGAIQARGGGSLFIGPGTYCLNSTHWLPVDLHLFGAGQGATIVQRIGWGDAFTQIFPRNTPNASNTVVEQLTVRTAFPSLGGAQYPKLSFLSDYYRSGATYTAGQVVEPPFPPAPWNGSASSYTTFAGTCQTRTGSATVTMSATPALNVGSWVTFTSQADVFYRVATIAGLTVTLTSDYSGTGSASDRMSRADPAPWDGSASPYTTAVGTCHTTTGSATVTMSTTPALNVGDQVTFTSQADVFYRVAAITGKRDLTVTLTSDYSGTGSASDGMSRADPAPGSGSAWSYTADVGTCQTTTGSATVTMSATPTLNVGDQVTFTSQAGPAGPPGAFYRVATIAGLTVTLTSDYSGAGSASDGMSRVDPTKSFAFGSSIVKLRCVSGGTTGAVPPFGQLTPYYSNGFATVPTGPAITVTGTPTSAGLKPSVKCTLGGTFDGAFGVAAQIQYSVDGGDEGGHWSAPVTTAASIPDTTFGSGLTFSCSPTGTYLGSNNSPDGGYHVWKAPRANFSLVDGSATITDGTCVWQVIRAGTAFNLVDSYGFDLNYVTCEGNYGVILDQSEVCNFTQCTFHCTVCAWSAIFNENMPNDGVYHQKGDTSLNCFQNCEFDGGIGAVIDDAFGYQFNQCNYNVDWNAAYLANNQNLTFDGGDIEGGYEGNDLGAFMAHQASWHGDYPTLGCYQLTLTHLNMGGFVLDHRGSTENSAAVNIIGNDLGGGALNSMVCGAAEVGQITIDGNGIGQSYPQGILDGWDWGSPQFISTSQQGGCVAPYPDPTQGVFGAPGGIIVGAVGGIIANIPGATVPGATVDVSGTLALRIQNWGYVLHLFLASEFWFTSSAPNNDMYFPGASICNIFAKPYTTICAPFTITGIHKPTYGDGQIFEIRNFTGFDMTLTHQDTRSCSGNRFICHTACDIMMPGVKGGFSACRIQYDVSQSAPGSGLPGGAWLVLPGHG